MEINKECPDCGRPFILDTKSGEYKRICDYPIELINVNKKSLSIKERMIEKNMCIKKDKYDSEILALKVGRQSLADYRCERDRILRAYLCPYCHYWHLTHSKKYLK
jgi:hypothetical protein